MNDSDWIPSEISYSLRKVSRDETQSQRNGIVGVIQKIDGGYGWIKSTTTKADGCTSNSYREELLPQIIRENRYNQYPKVYSCERCKTVSQSTGSYISLIEEDDFIARIDEYIEQAFKKSENDCSGYKISVTG